MSLKDESVLVDPTFISCFLLGHFLLGLLSYIWAFSSRRHKLGRFKEFLILSLKQKESQARGVQNTYSCLVALLSMDVLNAVSAVAFAAYLLHTDCRESLGCVIFSNIWFVSRSTALIMHSITALISVLFLCRPDWEGILRCATKVLYLFAYLLIPFYSFYFHVVVLAAGVYDFVLIVAIVGNCSTLLSSKAAAQRKSITILAVVTFLFICLPGFILYCLMFESLNKLQIDYFHLKISTIILHTTNFHLFLDGLLCHLVLKLSADDEEEEARQ